MKHSLESNIWKMYVLRAVRWFLLIMPVIVLFFQENGLSMREVLLLQAIFSVGIIVFEVPSGYLADIIGRRVSIVAGTILGFVGFAIYSFSFGFWGFLMAELVLGLGASFISGADSAIIYDSLLQLKKQNQYKKIEGRLVSVGNFSEGIASLLGGFLAAISLRTPLYVETTITFLAIPVALSLIEPQRHVFKSQDGNFRQIMRTVKYALHGHAEVKWLIMYSAVISASTLVLVWFVQPYLQQTNLPIFWFGIVWALLQFSVGIFSLFAYKVESYIGRKRSLILLVVAPFIGYILLSYIQVLWAAIFFLIFYFVRGIHTPVLKDYINRLIPSNQRATILSVRSLAGRLLFAVVGPFIGWINDLYSLQSALLGSGIIFFFLGLVSLLFLHKNKRL